MTLKYNFLIKLPVEPTNYSRKSQAKPSVLHILIANNIIISQIQPLYVNTLWTVLRLIFS